MTRRGAGWLGVAIGGWLVGCTSTPDEVTDSSSGSGSDDGSDGEPVAAVCGNDQIEIGEDCEDGNDDPLDGCVQCRDGPTGLVFGAPFATPQHGNLMGGAVFEDDCPMDQVMVGLSGVHQGDSFLTQVQAHCGSLSLTVLEDGDFAVQVLPGEDLPAYGPGPGEPAMVQCPNNWVVTGFHGRSGDLIDQLVLHCAPVFVVDQGDDFAVELGTSGATVPLGGNGGAPFPQTFCGVGSVARGPRVRAGDGIDAFGLGCAPLVLVVGA